MVNFNPPPNFITTRVPVLSRNARNQYVQDQLSVFSKRRRGEDLIYVQSDHGRMCLNADSALRLADALTRGAAGGQNSPQQGHRDTFRPVVEHDFIDEY